LQSSIVSKIPKLIYGTVTIFSFDHMTDENNASDSFFPNPLSPFRQGSLRLHRPEIPSRALHLLDAGQAGELLMCYVGISANESI